MQGVRLSCDRGTTARTPPLRVVRCDPAPEAEADADEQGDAVVGEVGYEEALLATVAALEPVPIQELPCGCSRVERERDGLQVDAHRYDCPAAHGNGDHEPGEAPHHCASCAYRADDLPWEWAGLKVCARCRVAPACLAAWVESADTIERVCAWCVADGDRFVARVAPARL